MRTTKHGAAQLAKKHRVVGIPLALLGVGLVVCLAAALLTRGGDSPRRTADLSAPAVQTSGARESGSADAAAGATTAPTQPPVTSPPKARRTPKPSAAGKPSAATRSPRASSTPSAARTPSAPTRSPRVPSSTPSASRTESVGTSGSLAGRIKPGVRYSGVATAYEAADGNGACLFGPSDSMMIAAMNHTDYEAAKACGAYVLVRAANGASITVRIVNECPLPCAPGQIDLSHQAFSKLANLSVGRLPITWSLLSPAAAGAISIRYKDGSSQYWCGVQAIGHRNPLAALEVRTAGGWRKLHRTDYNYFLSTDGSGCGKAIRITDIYGERLTIDGIALKPNVAQATRVQFARH